MVGYENSGSVERFVIASDGPFVVSDMVSSSPIINGSAADRSFPDLVFFFV